MYISKFQGRGFSLIEMVITIVLVGILFSVVGLFLNRPIQAYTSLAQRADILDIVDLAISRMERDVRNAVPNSLRTKVSGNFRAIEMVNAIEGMRYRVGNPGGAGARLTIGSNDTSFNVQGKFRYAQYGSNGYRLVIYNTGAYTGTSDNPNAGVNVYSTSTAPGPTPVAGSHVITPASTIVTLSSGATEDTVTMNPAMRFGLASPRQRIYVVDTPISYVCDLSAGTLTRYWGYGIEPTQPIDSGVPPLSSANEALMARHVTSCDFTYTNGILGVTLAVTRGGESARLFYQINSNNSS